MNPNPGLYDPEHSLWTALVAADSLGREEPLKRA
jgi:hypothetical protein